MLIRVRFFGKLSESVGESADVDLADGATVADLRSRLVALHESSAAVLAISMVAVNTEFGEDVTPLAHDDEVAFLPPVSGG